MLVTGKGGVVHSSAPHNCKVRNPSSHPSQVEVLTTTLLISVGIEAGIEAGRMPGTAVMFSTLGV